MELTEREKKLMHSASMRRSRWLLVIGTAFIITPLILSPFVCHRLRDVQSSWNNTYSTYSETIRTKTRMETVLKGLLLETVQEGSRLGTIHFKHTVLHIFGLFFFAGLVCIMLHIMCSRYVRLIRKLIIETGSSVEGT